MRYRAILFVLLLVITGAYSNHFHNDFHFDDGHTIQENPAILSLKNIPRFFWDRTAFSVMPSHQGYRPLVTTTLAIDYALGGKLDSFYFHLSNFLWFLLIVVAVYLVVKSILEEVQPHPSNEWFSLFAAAWFGFHTANAETVNYIIARSDILSALGHMYAFVLYLRSPTARRYFLYLIPAAIGMFAKESSIMIVPVFTAYLYFFEEDRSLFDLFSATGMRSLGRSILRSMPMFIVCGALAWLTISFAGEYQPGGTSSKLYVLTQPSVLALYLKAFFLPNHLSADTDVALVTGLDDPRVPIGVIILLLFISGIVIASKRRELRPISFGGVWFLLILLPTSSFIPLAEVLNDHRTFLPYIGLTIALVSGLSFGFQKLEQGSVPKSLLHAIAAIAAALVLAPFAYATHQRNYVWKTEESLWKDVTEKSPLNGRGWMNYGLTQMATGRYPAAEAAFREALKTVPYYATLHINLGILQDATNRSTDAEESFRKALSYGRNEIEPYYYFAAHLRRIHKYDEARAHLEKALAIYPAHQGCLHLLMEVLADAGQVADLKTVAERTLSFYPADRDATAMLEGIRTGEVHAVVPAKSAESATSLLELSLSLYNLGKFEESAAAARKALAINPQFIEAHNNLCSALVMLKRYDEAIAACKSALAINPQYRLAANNLRWAESERAGTQ